ncbi:MAG: DegV family EDD domain-containing protein [Oscillospiraceae bacterium]|nr:DegV family EDD domain-containing protein [Oscillospiraceae bacterium]
MAKYYIVTETGGDLLPQDTERYGIKIVPMHVQMEGETLDDGSFSPVEIFRSYERTKQLPKTSATNPHEYRQAFDEILAGNPDAIIIHLAYSAITTASFHNATLASDGAENIIHIDTKQVTGGQRAVVLKIAQFIEENPDATVEQVKAEAGKWVDKARFVFFPGDLGYLKAGGRVSNAAYLVASILGLKPLIEMLDGKLVGTKKYRGSDSKIYPQMLKEYLTENKLEKDSFFMVYSEGIDGKLKTKLEETAAEMGYGKVMWVPTGCVISTHSGPGAFGVGGFVE